MTLAKPRLIFVEGVIGCGKTTCLQNLESYFTERGIRQAKVVYEPVELWQSLGLLHSFYEDRARWAYTFQNMAFITKMMLLESLDPDVTYIIERSPYVDRHVFAQLCFDDGYMTEQEWRVYNMWYSHYMAKFEKQFSVEFVYIQANADVCVERVKRRARSEESDIPVTYFSALCEKHDAWLLPNKTSAGTIVHYVDGSQAEKNIRDAVLEAVFKTHEPKHVVATSL